MKGSPDGKKNVWIWVVVLVVILLVVVGLVLAERRKKVGGGMYGGGDESGYTHMLLPAGKGPHTHLARLDEEGSGISTEDEGHRHAVEQAIDVGLSRKGKIVPADHTHDITDFVVSKE